MHGSFSLLAVLALFLIVVQHQAHAFNNQRKWPSRFLSSSSSTSTHALKSKSVLQAVIEMQDGKFDEIVVQSTNPVLVDFYADWCGPCKMMAPIFEQLSQEMPNVKFVKVNSDEHEDVVMRYNVQGLPTFGMFINGKLVAFQPGAMRKEMLQDFVQRAINKA